MEHRRGMTEFRVTTRIAQPGGPKQRRRASRARLAFYDVLRYVNNITIVGGLFGLSLILFHTQWLFILLPVGLSLVISPTLFRNRKLLLVTAGVAVVYYTVITLWELWTHNPSLTEIIIITTTLATALLLEPVRAATLNLLDRRFHLRQDATARAIEAFTTSLREEIELDQVRERLLDVTQTVLRPRVLGLWVRADPSPQPPPLRGEGEPEADSTPQPTTVRAEGEAERTARAGEPEKAPLPVGEGLGRGSAAPLSVGEGLGRGLPTTTTTTATVDASDPFAVYARQHPGAIELDRLRLDSEMLRELRANEVEIALPLASQGELLGLLTLGPRISRRRLIPRPLFFSILALLLMSMPTFTLFLYDQAYTREDLDRLDQLGVQVAPALRVAYMVRLQQSEVRQRERIAQELRTAQQIQHTFLPKEVPALPGWHLAPYYQPAREVGGDFYDFLPLADGRLGIVLGDVTDKGVPAALVMTATRSMLRAMARESDTPGTVLARVNDQLAADIPPGMFVTCFYAILDPATGHLAYANAGQDLPYLRRADGSVGELRARGMPLGLMPAMDYEEREATLAPGDTLLFYSDGLVEAHNPRREMFGFPRLADLLAREPSATADAPPAAPLIDTLLGAMAAFTGPGWEQEDDVTLVALHRADLARNR
jgi:serine phosphatase RsbU (regulator of sigma subunit)